MQTTFFFVVFHQQFAAVCQTKHTGASLAHRISAAGGGFGGALPLCFVNFPLFLWATNEGRLAQINRSSHQPTHGDDGHRCVARIAPHYQRHAPCQGRTIRPLIDPGIPTLPLPAPRAGLGQRMQSIPRIRQEPSCAAAFRSENRFKRAHMPPVALQDFRNEHKAVKKKYRSSYLGNVWGRRMENKATQDCLYRCTEELWISWASPCFYQHWPH